MRPNHCWTAVLATCAFLLLLDGVRTDHTIRPIVHKRSRRRGYAVSKLFNPEIYNGTHDGGGNSLEATIRRNSSVNFRYKRAITRFSSNVKAVGTVSNWASQSENDYGLRRKKHRYPSIGNSERTENNRNALSNSHSSRESLLFEKGRDFDQSESIVGENAKPVVNDPIAMKAPLNFKTQSSTEASSIENFHKSVESNGTAYVGNPDGRAKTYPHGIKRKKRLMGRGTDRDLRKAAFPLTRSAENTAGLINHARDYQRSIVSSIESAESSGETEWSVNNENSTEGFADWPKAGSTSASSRVTRVRNKKRSTNIDIKENRVNYEFSRSDDKDNAPVKNSSLVNDMLLRGGAAQLPSAKWKSSPVRDSEYPNGSRGNGSYDITVARTNDAISSGSVAVTPTDENSGRRGVSSWTYAMAKNSYGGPVKNSRLNANHGEAYVTGRKEPIIVYDNEPDDVKARVPPEDNETTNFLPNDSKNPIFIIRQTGNVEFSVNTERNLSDTTKFHDAETIKYENNDKAYTAAPYRHETVSLNEASMRRNETQENNDWEKIDTRAPEKPASVVIASHPLSPKNNSISRDASLSLGNIENNTRRNTKLDSKSDKNIFRDNGTIPVGQSVENAHAASQNIYLNATGVYTGSTVPDGRSMLEVTTRKASRTGDLVSSPVNNDFSRDESDEDRYLRWGRRSVQSEKSSASITDESDLTTRVYIFTSPITATRAVDSTRRAYKNMSGGSEASSNRAADNTLVSDGVTADPRRFWITSASSISLSSLPAPHTTGGLRRVKATESRVLTEFNYGSSSYVLTTTTTTSRTTDEFRESQRSAGTKTTPDPSVTERVKSDNKNSSDDIRDLKNNSTQESAQLNQWPVKHSAVVEGDLVLGGLMMVHEREDTITCGPVMPQGGVQALEAMLYTLDRLNADNIVPGVKIGAHILDDCDKDTYGLEMAVDFIKEDTVTSDWSLDTLTAAKSDDSSRTIDVHSKKRLHFSMPVGHQVKTRPPSV